MIKLSPDHPWQIRGHRTVYDNPWIRLNEYDTVDPAGKPRQYGVIHFKNIAVGIVPVQDDHIWLVGQHRLALGTYSWEMPEGGCEAGEDPIETAHRELREEAGLKAGRMEPFLKMHMSNSVTDEWAEVFLATELTEVEAAPEDSEDITIARIPLSEFFERVENGDITDSLTVVAAYKLKSLKLSGKLG